MNKKVFYDFIRNLPFGGTISPNQFDGIEKILDYAELNYPDMDPRWLAYILATIFHETDRTMQPIKEKGGDRYLRSKKYYPYYGRGLAQITWKDNYDYYGITNLDDALQWSVALHVTFDGMINGRFTRKRLSQFFNKTADDPKGARKIINGTDRDTLVAQYHKNFLDALQQAQKAVEAPSEVRKPVAFADLPDKPELPSDPITQIVGGVGGVGILSNLFAAITNPYALGFAIVIAIGVGIFLYQRKKVRDATGV